jgi:AcrR family transcriptional regulator
MLDREDPAAAPAEELGWQAQKSAATRNAILDSAIACIVELGYGRATTTAIAHKAGLSRGAMLHHFPSKLDIIRGAVEHLHNKRLKAFRRAMSRVPPPGADRVALGVDAFFDHVRHPLFVAFLELSVAARTDTELAGILKPTAEAFEREWYRTAKEVFPEWHGRDAQFDIALDLSRYVMEGMAISFLTHRGSDRDRRILEYLGAKLHELRDT